MEFPFELKKGSVESIHALTQHAGKVDAPVEKHKKIRDLKALSYVMLHEALRTRLPGQGQIDAYNNFINFELPDIVREQSQPIEVHSINNLNNVAIQIIFTDISVEAPTHTEPDGRRVHLHPKDVSERRIPYDINVSVDLCLKQTMYEIVPPLRNYGDGKAFYAPCLLVSDPYHFNGWGLAIGRATTGSAQQHVETGQVLRFLPGVFESFHADALARHNRRSKCPVKVDGFKRQLWSKPSNIDQKTWNFFVHEQEHVDAPCMACVKLLVFIGYRDKQLNHFVVTKMGKRTLFDTFGDILATLPPYIEQCDELKLGSKTEYAYGIPFIRLPCMLGSEYCHTFRKGMEPRMDSGIVMTGSCDKVVITQQQLGNNRVFLFNQKAGQVIAEVRSAHIGKRRSTSAFRLILNPKDGAYVLLPFLKRSSGTDVRVHIVDFIRLLWEFDLFEDPDLQGVQWSKVHQFLDLITASPAFKSEPVLTPLKITKPTRPFLRCVRVDLSGRKSGSLLASL